MVVEPRMQIIDFFKLERSLQDRFVEAANAAVPPKPLAFKPAASGAVVLAWWAASVASALVGLGVLAMGFGSLSSVQALLGTTWIFVLALAIALSVLAALRALARDHEQGSLPYRAGVYVFPIGVVDARTDVLRVHRFPHLKDVEGAQRKVKFVFDDGARFELDVPDAAHAEQLVSVVEQHRQRVSGHSGPPSSRELAGLDPLADTGFKSPFTPTEPLKKTSPRWLRFAWVPALLAGAALAPVAWYARNLVSEERLYAAARNLGTAEAYTAYLVRGGARSDVREVLLPQAELRQAIAQSNVAALEPFMADERHRHIRPQAEAALKVALTRELAGVAAKGSLSELQLFERSQKHAELVRAELDLRKKELYNKAALAFRAVAQPSTPGLYGFFGRLLFYAQEHGPEVEIVFRRGTTDPNETEAALQKSAYYLGPEAMPTRFLRAEEWETREREVGIAIEARLNREFSPDILRFVLKPTVVDDGAELPKVTRPTLFISHRAELSGAFMSKKPRGVFVGLGLMTRSSFLIPGDAQPLSFKFSSWLSPDMKVWESVGATPKDVYQALARESFARLQAKQLSFLLKAP